MPRNHAREREVRKNMELDRLFAQEVRTRQESIRQQAVQAVLARHGFGDEMTVQEFLNGLRTNKDMWEVVSSMGLGSFAACIGNVKQLEEENCRLRAEISAMRSGRLHNGSGRSRRTRLRNIQKDGLKQAVLQVLQQHPRGLPRLDMAAQIPDSRIRDLGLPRTGLSVKLRIPIQELLTEGLLATIGEKRFMRYLLPVRAEEGRAAPSVG